VDPQTKSRQEATKRGHAPAGQINIPEIVNLVFFKMVRSKTKFWQMVGRGTRLRPDLFGIGQDKKLFYIFDCCQNLEFFGQTPDTVAGSANESLSRKLFSNRVELIAELDKQKDPESKNEVRKKWPIGCAMKSNR
jgi:type I restriction enzyme R subunit